MPDMAPIYHFQLDLTLLYEREGSVAEWLLDEIEDGSIQILATSDSAVQATIARIHAFAGGAMFNGPLEKVVFSSSLMNLAEIRAILGGLGVSPKKVRCLTFEEFCELPTNTLGKEVEDAPIS